MKYVTSLTLCQSTEPSSRSSIRAISTLSSRCSAIVFLIGPDGHAVEFGGSVRRHHRYVEGITAARDPDAPSALFVVARVERPPHSAQVGLEPGAEIHH